jgi:dihydroorotate dehydrogenase/Pyruvate/2-oxoacid:ferredoxin oxidoreductase delta subunit
MIEFAGLKLKNPFVVASSPLTAKVHLLKQAEEVGAAAASAKLTFIKQPFYGKLRMYNAPKEGSIVCHDRRLDLEEGQRLISETRRVTRELLIFANITHAAEDLEGWAYLARAMQEAGAHAVEANMICPNLGMTAKRLGQVGPTGGGAVGQSLEAAAAVTRALKESVSIPVICKLTPNVTDVALIARACEDAGADGICLAGGHLALPPMDIYHPENVYPLLQGSSMGSLGGPATRLLGFAMVASTARRVSIPIIGGGGLEKWEHAIQYMMWGATLVTACTAIMWHGYEIIPRIIRKMEQFVEQQGYGGYQDLVGRSLPTLRAARELAPIVTAPAVDPERCNGCGLCLKPGHCEAITLEEGLASVHAEDCLGCGVCVAICPRSALTFQQVTEG